MFTADKEMTVANPAARTGEYIGLAGAIRRGSEMVPRQCFGRLEIRAGIAETEVVATCAIGAADYVGYVGWVGGRPGLLCPVCSAEERPTIRGAVVHLNDDHRWTREAIADWLETL